MRASLALVLAVISSLSIGLFACNRQSETAAAPPADIVAPMQLPVSQRIDPQPQGASHRIEISPTELRLEGATVTTLTAGLLPAAERTPTLTKLRDALARGTAHPTARLEVNGTVPFGTTLRVIATLVERGTNDIAFKVRRGGSAEAAWLHLRGPRIVASTENATFRATQPVLWDDFTRAWQDVQASCVLAGGSCSTATTDVARGGSAALILRARGDGAQIEVSQMAPPDAGVQAAAAQRVEMLEGVPAAAAPTEEETIPPATEASFTFRGESVNQNPSPFTLAMAPLCGARACPVFVASDEDTMTMRVVTLLGAAFPTGKPAPEVLFVTPARR